jgi:hypothetical protein
VVTRLWLLIGLLAGATLSHAQAVPTASRAGDLQVGFGYGVAIPDYTNDKFKGIAPYATFDFTPHIGVEVDFRLLKGPSNNSLYEKTYEIGGRYHIDYKRLKPYGKIMVGRGVFNFPNNVANLAYNMYALGGGTDVRVLPFLNVRADFEYQSWYGFPPHGLSPLVGTVGVAYRFH